MILTIEEHRRRAFELSQKRDLAEEVRQQAEERVYRLRKQLNAYRAQIRKAILKGLKEFDADTFIIRSGRKSHD
jgi:hypothetical protein